MKHILVLVLLLLAAPAKADFLVEPYLGYQVSGVYEDATAPNDNINALTLGAMVGYDYLGLQITFDYMMGLETEIKPASGAAYSPALKGSQSQMSVNVGYQVPALIRFFAGYVFLDEVTSKQSGFTVIQKGSGFKVGASYSIVPMLNVGVVYTATSYKDGTLNGISFTNTTQPKFNAIMLMVSVPVTF